MLWIRDTHFSDQVQPACLQIKNEYFFCFSPSTSRTQELVRLGFQHTNDGFIAPLDYRLAEKLRALPGFEDIYCEWKDIARTPAMLKNQQTQLAATPEETTNESSQFSPEEGAPHENDGPESA